MTSCCSPTLRVSGRAIGGPAPSRPSHLDRVRSPAMARVLLIEDNDPLRGVLQENLALAGHTVIEARNGQEGLDHFRQSGADLVITDLVMPGMEGIEVLMALRAAHTPVKVIAMSGGGSRSGRQYLDTARLLGAVKVLLKPFPITTLLAAVNEALSDNM